MPTCVSTSRRSAEVVSTSLALFSITLEDIRLGGPSGVAKKLLSAETCSNRVFIVNAASESDMHVFVADLLDTEK